MPDLSLSFGAFIATEKQTSWSNNTFSYCKEYRLLFSVLDGKCLFRGTWYDNKDDAQMAAYRRYLKDYYKKNGVFKERLRSGNL